MKQTDGQAGRETADNQAGVREKCKCREERTNFLESSGLRKPNRPLKQSWMHFVELSRKNAAALIRSLRLQRRPQQRPSLQQHVYDIKIQISFFIREPDRVVKDVTLTLTSIAYRSKRAFGQTRKRYSNTICPKRTIFE